MSSNISLNTLFNYKLRFYKTVGASAIVVLAQNGEAKPCGKPEVVLCCIFIQLCATIVCINGSVNNISI